MIRITIPFHLRTLCGAEGEIALDVIGAAPTLRDALDALEAMYPMLKGTIRDHVTRQRRPFIRFFACGVDLSNDGPNVELPEGVIISREPLMVIGAIAGG